MNQIGHYLLLIGPWNPWMLVVAFGGFALAVGTRFPRVLIVVAIACYAVLIFNPAVIVVPRVVDLRAVALALVIYAAMLRRSLPRFATLRGGIFPATMAYMVLGLALSPFSSDAGLALGTLLNLTVTTIFVWALLNTTRDDEVRSAICWVSGLMVIGSIVAVVVSPGTAIAGGRWRGLTSNANSLGIFAGIFMVSTKLEKSRWSAFPVIAVLLGSASRASALGLGLVAGPKVLAKWPQTARRAAAIVAIVVALPILHSVFFSSADTGAQDDSGLTRSANSRGDYWGEGVKLIAANPFTGVGVGSQPGLLSSSVLSPLVEIGVIAIIPLGMVVVAGVRKGRTEQSWSRSAFLLLSINSIFEMWLFAGGSFFFMVYLVAAYERRSPVRPGPLEPAGSFREPMRTTA